MTMFFIKCQCQFQTCYFGEASLPCLSNSRLLTGTQALLLSPKTQHGLRGESGHRSERQHGKWQPPKEARPPTETSTSSPSSLEYDPVQPFFLHDAIDQVISHDRNVNIRSTSASQSLFSFLHSKHHQSIPSINQHTKLPNQPTKTKQTNRKNGIHRFRHHQGTFSFSGACLRDIANDSL